MSRIIYQTDEGGVAVIIPTPQALETMTIRQIAEKDVPRVNLIRSWPTLRCRLTGPSATLGKLTPLR